MTAPTPDTSRAISLTIIFTMLATMAVFYMAANQWYAPSTPFLALAILGLLAGGVATLFSLPEGVDAQALQFGASAFAPLVLGVALGGAIGATWNLTPVRHRAINQAYKRSWHKAQERALHDPDVQVAGVACRGLLFSGSPDLHRRAQEALERRAEIISVCLDANSSSLVEETASRALASWFNAAVSSDAKTACARTNDMLTTTRFTPHVPAALLMCSLKASDFGARQCCAQALNKAYGQGDKLAAALTATPASPFVEGLTQPLMKQSLHQGRMSADDKQITSALALQSNGMQGYALAQGCAGIHHASQDQSALLSHFRSTTVRLCKIELKQDTEAAQMWSTACGALGSGAEGDRRPAIERFCGAIRDEAVNHAMAQAQTRMKSALNLREPASMASAILTAWSKEGPLSRKQMAMLRGLYRDGTAFSGDGGVAMSPLQRAQLDNVLRQFGVTPPQVDMRGMSPEYMAILADPSKMEGIPGGNLAAAMNGLDATKRAQLQSALGQLSAMNQNISPAQRLQIQSAYKAFQLNQSKIKQVNVQVGDVLKANRQGAFD